MEKFYNIVYFIVITIVSSIVGYFFFFYGVMTLGYNPPFSINLIPAYISLILGYIILWPTILYGYIDSLEIGEGSMLICQFIGYALMWYLYSYINHNKKNV